MHTSGIIETHFLSKDINRYMFLNFIFDLKYLIRVQRSEQLHAKRSTSREKDKFKIILTDYIHYLT